MKLELLQPAKGSVKNNTRQGRGQGSGGGGTARRGHKGAKSRSGYSAKRGFEGGQMPLQRRVPKFGFKNINRIEFKPINLDALQALVDKTGTKVIDLAFLYENGLTQKNDLVKILGRGELNAAVEVKVNGFSKSAQEAIEKAGGKAIVDSTGNAINTENTDGEAKKPKAEKPVKVKTVAGTNEAVESKAKNVANTTEDQNAKNESVDASAAINNSADATTHTDEGITAANAMARANENVSADDNSKASAETSDISNVDVEKKSEENVEGETGKKSKKTAASNGVDDLKIIEGIGPKIAELLIEAGISTFKTLAETPVEKIEEILVNAGSRFAAHNPATWGQQAQLAADGKMDELKELQDRLMGGRPE